MISSINSHAWLKGSIAKVVGVEPQTSLQALAYYAANTNQLVKVNNTSPFCKQYGRPKCA